VNAAAVLRVIVEAQTGPASASLAKFDGQLAATAANADRSLGRVVGSSERVVSAGKRMEATGRTITGVGKAIGLATVPLGLFGYAAGKASMDYTRAMELIHTQAGATQKEVGRLEQSVLGLARNSPQGPTELANALFRLEGAGLRGKKAMDALRASSKLAMVGRADVEETAKTLSQVWFTDIKGAEDFKRVVAEVNATVGAGDLRLPQLVDALGTGVLASAKQVGLSLQDINGALAVFGDETNNVSGWSAQLATAFHFLTNPTEKAKGALKSIGLTGSSLAVDMHKHHGLLTALSDLREHLDKLPGGREGVEAGHVLGDILPGGRGRVLLVLLNQLDRYEQKMQQIKGTTDRFGDAVKRTNEQPAVKLEKAWSSIQADMVEIGGSLLPVVVPGFEHLAHFADGAMHAFSSMPPGLQSSAVEAGLISIGLAGGLIVTGKLITAVGTLREAMTGLVAVEAGGALFGDLRAASSLAMSGELGGFRMLGTDAARALGGGLVKALPVAIAGAGLVNVVDSGLHGDWEGVGFKAGGAVVGGIAGAFLGPEGAMVGAGIGSFIGGLLEPTKKLTPLQAQMAQSAQSVARALGNEHDSAQALKGVQVRVAEAQEHVHRTSHELRHAEERLTDARKHGKEGSLGVFRAETRVFEAFRRQGEAIDDKRRALENLHFLEKQHGKAIGEVVHSSAVAISVEERHIERLRQRMRTEGASKNLTEAANQSFKRLAHYQSDYAEAIRAAKNRNVEWARSLEDMTPVQHRFGEQGRALNRVISDQKQKVGEIRQAIREASSAYSGLDLRQAEGKLRRMEHTAGQVNRSIVSHMKIGQKETAAAAFLMAKEVAVSAGSMDMAVSSGLGILGQNLNSALKGLGVGKKVTFDLKAIATTGIDLAAAFLGRQSGGFTVPGTGSGDSWRTVVPANSFVMNREASRAYGLQSGGHVPVVLEPGERVFMPHEVSRIGAGNLAAMNASVPRFQKGGHLGPEPQLAGPAGPLAAIGQAAIHQVFKGAESVLARQKTKSTTDSSHSYNGHSLSGKVSWFSGGATAGGSNTSRPGVALNLHPGTESGWDNKITRGFMADSLAGHPDYIRLSINGHTAVLPITDLGPAGFTNRAIDVTEGGVRKLGFSTGAFPTDTVGKAVFLQHGGSVSEGTSPAVDHLLTSIWGRAAHLYGRSGSSPYPPGDYLAKGLTRTYGDVGRVVQTDSGKAVFFDKGWMHQLMRHGEYAEGALLHEWAHVFQRGGLDRWQREGGATDFARWAAPQVFTGYSDTRYPRGYRGFAERVEREMGPGWIQRGQFLQEGGLVGLAAGGSPSGGKPLSTASLPLFLRSGSAGPADATHVVKWAQAHLGQTRDYGYPGEWCGAFVGADMQAHGITPPSGYPLAAAWGGWGTADSSPRYGDVVVIGGSGHVGLALGGNRMISGNFSNKVAESTIGEAAGGRPITGYRTPPYTHTDSKNPGETKAQEVAHTYKEDVPAIYHGCRTDSLHFPSIPKTLQGVEREIGKRRAELGQYRRVAKLAAEKNRPAIAQVLKHNITALEARLKQLQDARAKQRREVVKKRFSQRLHRGLGKVTGYEQLIEAKQRAYNIASQNVEQIVGLEPQEPILPASASDSQREAAEKSYLQSFESYVNGTERPAFQDILGKEAEWRNTILKAEYFGFGKDQPSVSALEWHWEGKIYEVDTEIENINAYSERVKADIEAFKQQHPKAKELPDGLKKEIAEREKKRARLPTLRAQDKELRTVLGEGRSLFYPGVKNGVPVSPPTPPLPGTGSFEDALIEVQGIHWPDQHGLLGASDLAPPRKAGRFGGAIWDTQSSIEELGLKIQQAGAGIGGSGGGAGGSEGKSEREQLLESLLHQAAQREAVANALGPTLAQFQATYPFMGAFAKGGVALVGEAGPEIAHFPTGTRIHSADDTRRMLGGQSGPTTLVIEELHVHPDGRVTATSKDPNLRVAVKEIIDETRSPIPTPGSFGLGVRP